MRTLQTGIGAMQLLLAMATLAAISFVVTPKLEATTDAMENTAAKAKVAEALNFAKESRQKIARSFMESDSLPRTASEAYAMKPAATSRPEFVREVRFQHDHAGETVMIMVYLENGVVENVLGGEQYLYIAGIKSHHGDGKIEWQCGARSVDLKLLPEECRS